jgi:hypothetical protein
MEPNIHIISEFPDKHYTEISNNEICYYIGKRKIFTFHSDNICVFWPEDIEVINDLLSTNINKNSFRNGLCCLVLYNDKIKELINNHTLTEEETITFKDFLYEPEFKLNFVD